MTVGSGIATGGARGEECHPDSEKNAKNRGKEFFPLFLDFSAFFRSGKFGEKRGRNREEMAKIGKVFSLCPS